MTLLHRIRYSLKLRDLDRREAALKRLFEKRKGYTPDLLRKTDREEWRGFLASLDWPLG